jgi:hypothetical protein
MTVNYTNISKTFINDNYKDKLIGDPTLHGLVNWNGYELTPASKLCKAVIPASSLGYHSYPGFKLHTRQGDIIELKTGIH